MVRGVCQQPWEACRDRPSGFVDGVALGDAKACAAFSAPGGDPEANDEAAAAAAAARFHFLWRTNAHASERLRPLVKSYCESVYGAASPNAAALLPVSEQRDLCPSEYANAERIGGVRSMSRDEFVRGGGIGNLIPGKQPVVIRGRRTGSGDTGSKWAPQRLKDRLGASEVTVTAFDQARDGAQDLFTTAVRFSDFVDWTLDPTLFTIDTAKPNAQEKPQVPQEHRELVLYLLLTTRHLFEGLPSTEGLRSTTNPNGPLVANPGPWRDLLGTEVRREFGVTPARPNGTANEGGDRWAEAWTSLRLGGRWGQRRGH